MATCKDCNAEVLWLRLAEHDRPIAVNYRRGLGGPVRNEDDGARFVKADPNQLGFFPHYVTCPMQVERRAQRKAAKKAEREAKEKRQLRLFG